MATGGLTVPQRQEVDLVQRAARTLSGQLGTLLSVVGAAPGRASMNYTQVDLVRLVNLAAVHFDGIARERRIRFEMDAPQTLRAQVDEEKLQRALFSLLVHAVRNGSEGGLIRCQVRQVKRLAAITFRYDGAPAGLTDGTGLLVVRALVELLQGTAAFGADPEGGWRIQIELPLAAPAGFPVALPAGLSELDEGTGAGPGEVPLQRVAATERGPEIPRPQLLVVEDNPPMNRFISGALRPKYRVASAFDGKEGLALALELRPDLIISDVIMPGMSGDQFLQAVREHPDLKEIPVILLSGKAEEEFRVQALRSGAQDFIVKPFSVLELDARVGNLIAIKQTRELLQKELASQTQDVAVLAAEMARSKREHAFLAAASKELSYSLDYGATLAAAARLPVPYLADTCAVRIFGEGDRVHATAADRVLPVGGQTDPGTPAFVSLVARGQTLGRLEITAADDDRFSKSGLGLAEDYAFRAALAIDNARLFLKQQEATRQNAEALAVLDAFLGGAPGGSAFFDQELRYVRVNQYLADLHGLPPDDHIGRSIQEVFPALSETIAPAARRVLQTEEPIIWCELKWQEPTSGKHRHWSASLYPVRTKDGRVLGVGLVIVEVTERREMEEALRAANEQLQNLINASPFPIVSFDREGVVRTWNPAAQDLFGWSEAEAVGAPLRIVPQARHLESNALLDRLRRGDSTQGLVTRRSRRDGTEVDVCLHSVPLHDAAGNISGGIALYQNISGRMRFLQIAAHELRNPMAAIKGILALQRRRIAKGVPLGDIAGALGVMEQEVDRLSTLFNRILEAFRIQEGQLDVKEESVDLAQIVVAALDPHRMATGKHRFVSEGLDQPPIRLKGDAGRLSQVFSNLLSNAVKYSPHGGEVRVRIQRNEQGAVVSVADQGRGMSKQQLSQVFQPFFRAAGPPGSDPGGMGLGLYVCRDIILRHQGQIWMESEEGAGTVVHVALPVQ